ncbi:MAG: hypothetical protein ACI3VM_03845 [Oscillospiraceae bacterium]
MQTAKEIFLEMLKPGAQPERQLKQYEALHMCLYDPINTYLRGNCKRGTVSVDRWGTTISFPEDAPGAMPLNHGELAVCRDITRWRETVHDIGKNLVKIMEGMRRVVSLAEEKGIRDKVRIFVGGAPISRSFCDEIGADVYTEDAGAAARAAVEILRSCQSSR